MKRIAGLLTVAMLGIAAAVAVAQPSEEIGDLKGKTEWTVGGSGGFGSGFHAWAATGSYGKYSTEADKWSLNGGAAGASGISTTWTGTVAWDHHLLKSASKNTLPYVGLQAGGLNDGTTTHFIGGPKVGMKWFQKQSRGFFVDGSWVFVGGNTGSTPSSVGLVTIGIFAVD